MKEQPTSTSSHSSSTPPWQTGNESRLLGKGIPILSFIHSFNKYTLCAVCCAQFQALGGCPTKQIPCLYSSESKTIRTHTMCPPYAMHCALCFTYTESSCRKPKEISMDHCPLPHMGKWWHKELAQVSELPPLPLRDHNKLCLEKQNSGDPRSQL